LYGLKTPSARECPLPDKASLDPLPAVLDLRLFGLLVWDLKALAAPACAARSGGREKHKQKSSSNACCDPLPSAIDAPQKTCTRA